MAYADLLKDPRWQRKRLEILNRDGFSCQHCWADDKTLHVHHKYYDRGAAPWDYPNTALVTLCEDCHVLYAEQEAELSHLFAQLPDQERGLGLRHLRIQVAAYVRGQKELDKAIAALESEDVAQEASEAPR